MLHCRDFNELRQSSLTLATLCGKTEPARKVVSRAVFSSELGPSTRCPNCRRELLMQDTQEHQSKPERTTDERFLPLSPAGAKTVLAKDLPRTNYRHAYVRVHAPNNQESVFVQVSKAAALTMIDRLSPDSVINIGVIDGDCFILVVGE